jgi:hypothetical protein
MRESELGTKLPQLVTQAKEVRADSCTATLANKSPHQHLRVIVSKHGAGDQEKQPTANFHTASPKAARKKRL